VARELALGVLATIIVGCGGSHGSTWLGSGGSGGVPSGGSQGLGAGGAQSGAGPDGGSGGFTAGAAGSGNADGSFAIGVDSASYEAVIASNFPVSGDRFVLIGVTLSNTSVPRPLSTGLANFSLVTDDFLVVLPSSASTLLEPRCRDDLAVAAGGIASCRLAFEVSATQKPAELVYDDQMGHADTAPIPAIPAPATTPCERLGSWLAAESPACSDCVSLQCADEMLALYGASACQDDLACVDNCAGACPCNYSCLATPGCREPNDAVWNCFADSCTPACQ